MAFSTDLAAFFLLYADVGNADVQIWGSSRLLALSMIGSCIGALLSIVTTRPPKQITETPRSLAFGFVCSMSCGVAFAPLALEWSGIAKREDMIIPFSAVCAFAAVKLAKTVMPILESAWVRKIRKILEVDDLTTHDENRNNGADVK